MDRDDRGKAPDIFRVLAYYGLLLTLVLVLVSGYCGIMGAAVFTILLAWCTRPKFPLRPRLSDKGFTATETRVWFSGAAAAIAAAIAISSLMLEGGVLQMLRSVGVGSASWAFAFLASRDVRRFCAGGSGGQTKNVTKAS